MSVFSLSKSVVSLPRLCLTNFGSHAFLFNCLVSKPYIVCSLVAEYRLGTAMTRRKYKTRYLKYSSAK